MKMQGIEKKSIMNFVFILIAIVVMTTACKKDELISPIDDKLSSEKLIKSFVFLQSKNVNIPRNAVGQVNEANKTIKFVMPVSTEIDGLLPDLETSSASSYSPMSVQNFTNPVEYTITAEDGSSVIYTVSVSVEKTEREVLQAILDANPSNTLGWNLSQTASLGDLKGVELNVQGNIEELILYPKSLMSIPAEIGNLVNLKILSLGGTSLTSLPMEIGNLKALRSLDLLNCSITSLPAEFGNLMNLQVLFIHNTSLTSLPAEFGNLIHLRSLSLGDNLIKSLPAEFGNLMNLEYFSLEGNLVTSLPSEIGFLHNLKSLSVGGNNLSSMPFAIYNLFKKNNLVINGANDLGVKTTDKDVLIAMNLGSTLQWGVNNYQGVSFDSDKRVIEIVGKKKDIKFIPKEIGTLTNLRVLNLDQNSIKSLPPSLGKIRGLEIIGLSSNQLRTLPRELGKLKNAVLMNLTNNPVQSIPNAVCNLQVSKGGKLTILTDPGEECN